MRTTAAAATCNWCGTRLRGRSTCPRGKQCAREEAEHARLEKKIRQLEKKGRNAFRAAARRDEGTED